MGTVHRSPHLVTDRVLHHPGVLELRLRPLEEPLPFRPGQQVVLHHGGAEPRPCRLPIAGAPRPDGHLRLLVDDVDAPGPHDTVRVGQQVSVDGPFGAALDDPAHPDLPVLCVAEGAGVAPMTAVVEGLLRTGSAPAVTMLVSAATRDHDLDLAQIRWWQEAHARFDFAVTYSKELVDGHPGSGVPRLVAERFDDLSGVSVRVAGSPAFVQDCSDAIRPLGAVDEQVLVATVLPRAAPADEPGSVSR